MLTITRITRQLIALTLQVLFTLTAVNSTPSQEKKTITLAITQIIEHPALDEEREALLKRLAEAGYIPGKNLTVLYQNAQGNIATTAQIASQFAGHIPPVTIAVGISTPSSQSLLLPLKKAGVPIVFTSVTDPLDAKLVATLDKRSEAITGVTDNVPMEPQLKLIQGLIPSIQKVGVIYNPGEPNSIKSVHEIKQAAAALNIVIVEATASKTSEIATATQSLLGKVGALLIPNDNTAVSAIEAIISIAHSNNLPVLVFAADSGSIRRGAVGGYVYDRTELGRKAAELILQILEGTPAGELPIAQNHSLKLTLNEKSAEKVNVQLTPAIKKEALIVGRSS